MSDIEEPPGELHQTILELQRQLSEATSREERISVGTALGLAERRAGEIEIARDRLLEIVAQLPLPSGPSLLELQARLALVQCLQRTQAKEQVDHQLDLAGRLLGKVDHGPAEDGEYIYARGYAELLSGKRSKALAHFDNARLLFEAAEATERVAECRAMMGMQYRALGNIALSTKNFNAAIRTARKLKLPLLEAMSSYNLALLELETGRAMAAKQRLESALRLQQEKGGPREEGITQMLLGHTQLQQEAHEAAGEFLDKALGLLEGEGLGWLGGYLYAGKAELAARTGDLDQAKEHIATGRTFSDAVGDTESLLWLERVEAIIAGKEQSWSETAQILERHLQRCQEEGFRMRHLWALREWARIADEAGQHEEARRKAEEARATARRMGLPLFAKTVVPS